MILHNADAMGATFTDDYLATEEVRRFYDSSPSAIEVEALHRDLGVRGVDLVRLRDLIEPPVEEAEDAVDLDALSAPADALGVPVVNYLADLDVRAQGEAVARLKSRWPRAGVWGDLRAAIRARRKEAAASKVVHEADRDRRPAILADDERHAVVCAAEAALAGSGAEVYVRGRDLTRILPGPTLEVAGVPWLGALLSCVARWYLDRQTAAGPARRYLPAPPREVVDALRDMGAWPRLRPLRGIVSHPVIRTDGTLGSKAGYDAASGLYLDTQALDVSIPERPTRGDALAAVDVLREPFSDFPFVAEADRSAALAALLTILTRLDHLGAMPAFSVDATTRGSGKGLIADAIAIIATGREPPRRSQCDSEEEWRKRILSVALSGVAVFLLDNVEKCLKSAALAAALTCRGWSDRLLGESRDAVAPLDCVFLITGNNIQLAGDLARRIVPIRLDPAMERPEERTGFRHPDLLDHVRRERGRYLGAALTVLVAHRAAGSPQPDRTLYPRIGSYETWDLIVRAALIWLDLPDPCDGRKALHEGSDLGRDDLLGALAAWHEAIGEDPVTVAEVVDRAKWTPDLAEALRGLIPPRKDGRDEIDPSALGYALRKHRGRVVGGLRLERDAVRATGNKPRWRVVRWQPEVPDGIGEDGMDGMDGIPTPFNGAGKTHHTHACVVRLNSGVVGGPDAIHPILSHPGTIVPKEATPCGACVPCRASHPDHCVRFGPR